MMREGCRVYGLLARLTGCLLAVVTLLPVAAAQTDFKPVILSFEGSVEVRKKVEATAGLKATAVTTSVNISTHQTLDTGDTIVTGRNGRLVIGLADGSQAVIAPKSTPCWRAPAAARCSSAELIPRPALSRAGDGGLRGDGLRGDGLRGDGLNGHGPGDRGPPGDRPCG